MPDRATKKQNGSRWRPDESTRWRLNYLGSYRVQAPYVIPNGMKTHGVNMIFAYFYYELGKAPRAPGYL